MTSPSHHIHAQCEIFVRVGEKQKQTDSSTDRERGRMVLLNSVCSHKTLHEHELTHSSKQMEHIYSFLIESAAKIAHHDGTAVRK